jgi:hypothetical protein
MVDRSLRCASQARAGGYLPAGTAASASVFVLVETPLPWPADVGEHAWLQPLAPALAEHGARLQALVPDDRRVHDGAGERETDGRAVRVVVYRQAQLGEGAASRYVRSERVTGPDALVETVAALLDDPGAIEPDDGTVDVLVCTHGSRDVCCGSDGIGVYRDLAGKDLPGVRVWRTSHTGGHRFAPTAVTFPDGRAWASVDAGLLAGVVTRTVEATIAVRHDRGCAALPDPFTQAADGAVLGVEGWSWLDQPRTVETASSSNDGRRTLILSGHRNGTGAPEPVTYRAELAVRRVVPVPECGRPLGEARKTSTEVEVVALEQVVAP